VDPDGRVTELSPPPPELFDVGLGSPRFSVDLDGTITVGPVGVRSPIPPTEADIATTKAVKRGDIWRSFGKRRDKPAWRRRWKSSTSKG